jgi:hypothetical protein
MATVRRLERRRILVMTTLIVVSFRQAKRRVSTYRIPIAKTPIRAIFCIRGSWSCASNGIGKMRRVTSVAMFIDALKNQTASKLRHDPGRS